MHSEQTAFLISCGPDGSIIRPYWYQPIYLLSPYHKNMTDLFSEKDAPILEELIARARREKDLFLCPRQLELKQLGSAVSLCLISAGKSVLILGLDTSIIRDSSDLSVLQTISHHFMRSIGSFESTFATGSEELVRMQFEQIQKLNNELSNVQRELKKNNAQLNRLNSDLNNRLVKDALTGLVSRYQYRTEIETLIHNRPDQRGVFAFIDIDDFKSINDTYGHQSGDIFLKTFAERLMKLPFDNAIFMRISGDEFGLYIHGYDTVSAKDIETIWRSIQEVVLRDPIDVGKAEAEITCSAGMAVYGQDTREVYDLIEYADSAMYLAKKSGKNSYRKFEATDLSPATS
ncbi:MAG TPA: hypothetical protein DF480_04185 [Clostridiales bacterium]|nr:hypothetical protein [Clostridiales bacterium]